MAKLGFLIKEDDIQLQDGDEIVMTGGDVPGFVIDGPGTCDNGNASLGLAGDGFCPECAFVGQIAILLSRRIPGSGKLITLFHQRNLQGDGSFSSPGPQGGDLPARINPGTRAINVNLIDAQGVKCFNFDQNFVRYSADFE